MTTNRQPDDDPNTPEDQQLLDNLACIQAQREQAAQDAMEKRLRAMPHLIRLLGLDGLRAEPVHGDDTPGVPARIETTKPKKEPDFLIEDFGAEIFLLRALEASAKRWAVEHFADIPMFAGALVIAPRHIGFVRRALPDAGFVTVEVPYRREDRQIVRMLSIMSILQGDVWGRCVLFSDNTCALAGNVDDLEDCRVLLGGPTGYLRPRDGLPYFQALKAMYDRASLAAVFEPHEEQEARRIVERFRASERKRS